MRNHAQSFKQFEAAAYFELANQIDSNSAVILNARGVYYLEQNEYIKAEEYYKKALLKAPLFQYPYRNLGDLYLGSKRFIESEEMFKIVLKLDSMNEYSISSLATLYLKTNQYTKSETYYVKALKIDSSAINFNNLGFFYLKLKSISKRNNILLKQYNLIQVLLLCQILGIFKGTRFNEANKI
ncbi:MAG: tetratricopeptide repeat protein [Saprospiraceae bacterium]|nr:tetratricopeptide repeat protein [Candidatus Vicinibacter affinis]